jgi:hypothetical protein
MNTDLSVLDVLDQCHHHRPAPALGMTQPTARGADCRRDRQCQPARKPLPFDYGAVRIGCVMVPKTKRGSDATLAIPLLSGMMTRNLDYTDNMLIIEQTEAAELSDNIVTPTTTVTVDNQAMRSIPQR